MTQAERAAILKWLDNIGEDDFGMICDVMDRCETIPEALTYFLMRAQEAA
jgi:hypothetical protein